MEDVGGHAMAQLQQEHEKKRHVLQAASSKLEKLVHSIQEYSRQKLENDMVLNELNMLSEDSTVYKRIGPCLVKQDMFEATSNVQKRIDYIMDELERLEKQKAVYDKEHKETTQQLQNIQVQVQRIMQVWPRFRATTAVHVAFHSLFQKLQQVSFMLCLYWSLRHAQACFVCYITADMRCIIVIQPWRLYIDSPAILMQSPPRVGRSVLRTNSNGHLQELQAAGQLET